MSEIIPTVVPKSLEAVATFVTKFKGVARTLHIDADKKGNFVVVLVDGNGNLMVDMGYWGGLVSSPAVTIATGVRFADACIYGDKTSGNATVHIAFVDNNAAGNFITNIIQ